MLMRDTSLDIRFVRECMLGRITLNRPKSLNALTEPMVAAMLAQLEAWRADAAIQTVLVEAMPGRAFCAGGDIRAILDAANKRDGSAASFFRTEYRLNAAIHGLPKPYVSLIDGLAFGGGLGISVHGSHCVVSEHAALAMPETVIGFFPDIGATHFLNGCPGSIGMYLALTGARLKAADLIYAGLATHFVPSANLALIGPALAAGKPPKPVLAEFNVDPGAKTLAQHRAAIDRAFAASSVEAIVEALGHEGEWGREIARQLAAFSPTSLKITHRLMREARGLDLETCLAHEYRVAIRMVESHDFAEGVRAAVIDKDQRPRWRPSRLEEVRDADIGAYFAPLGNGELTF